MKIKKKDLLDRITIEIENTTQRVDKLNWKNDEIEKEYLHGQFNALL